MIEHLIEKMIAEGKVTQFEIDSMVAELQEQQPDKVMDLRIEVAESNAEMFEFLIVLTGGMM